MFALLGKWFGRDGPPSRMDWLLIDGAGCWRAMTKAIDMMPDDSGAGKCGWLDGQGTGDYFVRVRIHQQDGTTQLLEIGQKVCSSAIHGQLLGPGPCGKLRHNSQSSDIEASGQPGDEQFLLHTLRGPGRNGKVSCLLASILHRQRRRLSDPIETERKAVYST